MEPSVNTTTVTSEATKGHHAALGDTVDGYTLNDIPYTGTSGTYRDPGIAKANMAATLEKPNGTTKENWSENHKHQTVLQQHVTYFDPDHDNIIWPTDIYHGTRAWGWNPLLALLTTLVISGGLSYLTCPSILPDPFFRIYVSRIQGAHHGSSSTTLDNAGRFRPSAFDEFFDNYDRGRKGGLTKRDLYYAWVGQRCAFDFFGSTAFVFEWVATYLLLWPGDGVLRKEEVRMVYDGSIFQFKADEYGRRKGGVRTGMGKGGLKGKRLE